MPEQSAPRLTLEIVDVFSTDRVVMRRPALELAVRDSVAADFLVRLLVLVLRQIPISRDHR